MGNGRMIPDAPVIQQATLSTPLGSLRVFAVANALLAVEFEGSNRALAMLRRRLPEFELEQAVMSSRLSVPLQHYFEGRLDALDRIEVAPIGTPFQKIVWACLRRIPPGTAISYGELARRVGRPRGTRAVGLANGRNPVPIIIPCHRVIGANGSLTGYGGGLDRKLWLLHHEGAIPNEFAGEPTPDR